MLKRTLVIQGGGFRTAFSTGVLDAFQSKNYNNFDAYVAVSGGAIALSYFVSGQYRKCLEAMCFLAENKNFMSWNRLISSQGIMDVDYFTQVAETKVPFDMQTALATIEGKQLYFVLTNCQTGEPRYYAPKKEDWVDAVIATCTMPFVTKGKHLLEGVEYFDGGWSDPLPVKWAHENGAHEMIVIRTTPSQVKMNQSWPDYFGTFIFRRNERLRSCFEENHLKYNAAVDYMGIHHPGLSVHQIAPEEPLQTGTYSNNTKLIVSDYRQGLEAGLNFLMENGL